MMKSDNLTGELVGAKKPLRNPMQAVATPGSPGSHQLVRLLSAEFSDAVRLSFARGFAAGMLLAYARAAAHPRPRQIPDDVAIAHLTPPAATASERLGQEMAELPPREAAHRIGAVYTTALAAEHRSRHGIFYTPPGLVSRLLDMAEAAGTDWRTARVLDPASGGGAFLMAAAERMVAALADVEPALVLKQLGHRLRGFEIDPFGTWLAQTMLDMQLATLTRRAARPAPIMVETRDSLDLREDETGSFDLVVGNPPYGRVSLLPSVRARFARSTYGHANLYGLFTDAALRWTAPGGIVGYVTPTSMLSGLYHKALRALLVREAPPVAVDLVAERAGVFDDVLQETMLAVYRRAQKNAPPGGRVGFLALGVDGRVTAHHAGHFTLPQDPEAPWLLPRGPDQVALTERLRAMPHRLADYGYGVSTGPLVWNRFKPQLRGKKGRNGFPVVWAESISADGRFAWQAQRRNHAPWFAANLPRDTWLLVDRPCVLLQRTTAKEQSRRLIAAELPAAFIRAHGAAVVENHLNMVRPIVPAPCVPSSALAALLNSPAADAAFRCINGSVAVSAFELEGMPVPPPAVMVRVAGLLADAAPAEQITAVIAAAYQPGTDAAGAA